MTEYIVRRLMQIPVALIGISIFVFVFILGTGDPVLLFLPEEASPEQVEELRETLGLNDPLPVQYLRFVTSAVRGDFGTSLRFQKPAMAVLFSHVPATVQLAILGMVFASILGFFLGTIAGIKQGSIIDKALIGFAIVAQSMPGFWVGIMLIMVFAVYLGWLPTSGRGDWRNVVLPATTLGIFFTPQVLLLTRSSLQEVLGEEYITVARAKGLREKAVLYRHAIKNALNPVVTAIGIQFGRLMGGAVVTETVFAWPGVGRLAIEAVYYRDMPIVQASVLFLTVVIVLSNLAADVANGLLDPRIRHA